MKVKLNWFAIFVGLLVTLLSVIGVFAVAHSGVDWSTWKQATSMMSDGGYNFNEKVVEGSTIRQPWCTISSLFYVFAGAFMICVPYTAKTKGLSISSSKVLRILFGLSIIITGLGSAFMHMSMTFIGQFFDVAGMYLVSVFIVMYAFRNKPKFSTPIFAGSYIVINALLLWALVYAPNLRRNLFLILILIGLILEPALNRKQKGYTSDLLLAAASSLLMGYILWQLDNYLGNVSPFGTNELRGTFFSQTGFMQGHNFWHMFGSIACYTIFAHYNKTYRAAHPEAIPAKEKEKEKVTV